jgi:hypothetical protein
MTANEETRVVDAICEMNRTMHRLADNSEKIVRILKRLEEVSPPTASKLVTGLTELPVTTKK